MVMLVKKVRYGRRHKNNAGFDSHLVTNVMNNFNRKVKMVQKD